MRLFPNNIFRVAKVHGLTEKIVFSYERQMEGLIAELSKEREKGRADFLNLPDDEKILNATALFAKQRKRYFSDVIVLGIGGSCLGGKALTDALGKPSQKNTPRIHFVDTVDPDFFQKKIDPRETLVLVISKSGKTLETLAMFLIAYKKLATLIKKNYAQHFVFITDATDNFLTRLAKKEGIITFPIPEQISGRYSVFSSVGLLPAALAGIDCAALLKGARNMRENAFEKNLHKNAPAFIALTQYLLDIRRDKNMTVIFSYTSRLETLCDWYLQLVAESLGKKLLIGPTPIKAIGPRDQHSQLQLYMEGPNNKQFLFLEVEKPNFDVRVPALFNDEAVKPLQKHMLSHILRAEKRATETALLKANRPNQTIRIPEITPEHIGELLMLLQIETVLRAKLYNVDPFNQPGVELGKDIAKKILLRERS